MTTPKKPNYLKFILIVIGIIFISLLILVKFSSPKEITNDPLTDLLRGFDDQSEIETSNLLNYVKKNIITEPTVNEASPVLGNAEAPITIFEFSCFGCPASADTQPILKAVLEKYGDDVKLVWKDLPIPDLYPEATLAHLAARCAQEQDRFWDYQNLLWNNQNDFSADNLEKLGQDIDLNMTQFTDCLSTKKFQKLIEADVDEAAQLAISGTPHFYINNQEIFGVATLEDFDIVINAELNR